MNNSGITPTGERLLIQVQSAEKRSKGGIILSDKDVTRYSLSRMYAQIIAIGEGAFHDRLAVYTNKCKNMGVEPEDAVLDEISPCPGDWVLIEKFAGSNKEIEGKDGETYRICMDDEVIATIKENKECPKK